MSSTDDGTKRIVAAILGLLGVFILVDVLVLALALEHVNFNGFRQALIVVVGALLLIGGVITFSWPSHGDVRSTRSKEA